MSVGEQRVVEKVLELNAPVERVWRAITEPSELSRWFGQEAVLEMVPGADGAFVWAEHGSYAVRVREVEPPNRLVWSWVHEAGVPFDEATQTTVEWILTPSEGGGTVLRLRETGFLTDLHQSQNDGGWDEELAELAVLVAG